MDSQDCLRSVPPLITLQFAMWQNVAPPVSKGVQLASRVFQACALGENANVLVPRVFKLVLAVERTSLLTLRVFQNAIVVLAQAWLALVEMPVSYLGLYAKHALVEVTLNFLSQESF